MAQSEIIDNNELVLQSIDKAFSRYGQSVATVVYWKFHFDTKLDKHEILLRPDLFSNAIRDIFREGAVVLEQELVRELRIQFNLPNRNYKNLEDVIGSIRVRSASAREQGAGSFLSEHRSVPF
jgi:hypothetical protein